jgi:flavin-dependent thymidylate synthase
MKINLSIGKPSDIAVGSARTCYSSSLITPEKTKDWDKKKFLLNDLFESGHHTTMQHTNFTFEISGMSRLLIWRLLHGHSFYNSDQVSQRYAKIKPGTDNFYYPETFEKSFLDDYYNKSYETYLKLTEVLTEEYKKSSNKKEKEIANKKAMENARYILPQAMKANLYHSVNIITLFRYIAGAAVLPEADTEAKEFSKIIESEILKIDDTYKDIIEEIKKTDMTYPKVDLSKFPELEKDELVKVFDISSGYGVSEIRNYSYGLNLSTIFHSNELMGGFTSRLKLSLSADAQNQRHRKSPGLRPLLKDYYKNRSIEEMYYIPDIFFKNKEAMSIYVDFLKYATNILNDNIDKKDVEYLFPNAFFIEIIEKNDFSNFIHKTKMRTCLNAQEEIRYLTEEQIFRLSENNIQEVENFVPPCVLRYREKIRAFCTEGSRYCGIPVWKDKKFKI